MAAQVTDVDGRWSVAGIPGRHRSQFGRQVVGIEIHRVSHGCCCWIFLKFSFSLGFSFLDAKKSVALLRVPVDGAVAAKRRGDRRINTAAAATEGADGGGDDAFDSFFLGFFLFFSLLLISFTLNCCRQIRKIDVASSCTR